MPLFEQTGKSLDQAQDPSEHSHVASFDKPLFSSVIGLTHLNPEIIDPPGKWPVQILENKI